MNERIKELRKALKLSQADFAEKLKVSRIADQKWESGENNISEALIYRIVKEFSVNETWLRTGEGEMFAALDPKTAYMDFFNTVGLGLMDEEAEWLSEFLASTTADERKLLVDMAKRLADLSDK